MTMVSWSLICDERDRPFFAAVDFSSPELSFYILSTSLCVLLIRQVISCTVLDALEIVTSVMTVSIRMPGHIILDLSSVECSCQLRLLLFITLERAVTLYG